MIIKPAETIAPSTAPSPSQSLSISSSSSQTPSTTPTTPITPDPLIPSHFGSLSSPDGKYDTFPSTPRGGPLPDHTTKRKFKLFWLQFISAVISNLLLLIIVSYALTKRFIIHSFTSSIKPRLPSFLTNPQTTTITSTTDPSSSTSKSPKHHSFHTRSDKNNNHRRDWDDPLKFKSERVTKDFHYYAIQAGFKIIEQTVETLDGYYLQVWKIVKPNDDKHQSRGGYPVLIQHGLFQSAGSFITSEERSLAFWLVEHGGYQVYLGNNRGIFKMGHRKLRRDEPRFWDYNMKELAIYDLPALVEHVLKDSGGYKRLAFIGHSQGNATMFCSLARGMIPSLGSKLSCFIALAPALYAGPLTSGFPFGLLKSMRWRTWRIVFGILDFLPIMSLCVDWLPSSIFGFLGYQMFAFLFNWTDRNWLLRRKVKMFRFTPSSVSSASIFWWTGYQGFSTRGCVLDPQVDQWWDDRFPPLALYHGESDYLVLADKLVERLKTHEKSVKLIRNFKLKDGEHCDTFWHIDAVELCFNLILEDIEKTKYVEQEEKEEKEEEEGTEDKNFEQGERSIVSKEDEEVKGEQEGGLKLKGIMMLKSNEEELNQNSSRTGNKKSKRNGSVKPETPQERLERMLCEPGSTDSKTREEILNRILYGSRSHYQDLPLAPLPLTTPSTAIDTMTTTKNHDTNITNLPSQPIHHLDLIDLDRDLDQAPVMNLEKEV